MASDQKLPPKTYGDLRKLLAEAGDPWQADPTRSDEEPLPSFTTGGDGNFEPQGRMLKAGELDELLKLATPPSNPDVMAVWRQEGLTADVQNDGVNAKPRRPAKKKSSALPVPSSGD